MGPVLTERGAPTHGDWVYVREFKMFLKHFYDLTNKVSDTKYVTSTPSLKRLLLSAICWVNGVNM